MVDDYEEYSAEGEERPRDSAIDSAKEALIDKFFPTDGSGVYYGRQLEVSLEGKFFHWITKKALNELVEERKIKFEAVAAGDRVAHFYWPLRHRYPRRQIRETLGLIVEFSDPEFTRAMGRYGELLVDAGFARIGFRVLQEKVRKVDGRRWTASNHDLDRLVERDGIRYGVEIKNQLGYIDQTEFQTKLAMCVHLGVRPLFIARMMPKNYNKVVIDEGGFVLLFKEQHYPPMKEDLAKRVLEKLSLPVACVKALPDRALARFERWHERSARGVEG